jgi:chemotaxis protein CheD
MLQSRGAAPAGLVAKIAGGARMFGDGVFARIGEANSQAVLDALQSAGIRVAGCDVGGDAGRRISFDLATGEVTVESIGRGPRTI